MSKYFIILCSLLVLAGCSGAPLVEDQTPEKPSIELNPGSGGGGGDEDVIEEVEGDDDGHDTYPSLILKKGDGCNLGTVNSAQRINCELTATGGSGSYDWSAEDLPDWLRLDEIDNDKVAVAGTAPSLDRDQTFRFKIKVCDAENTSICKEKRFSVKVKEVPRVTFVPPSSPLSIMPTFHIETALKPKESGMNSAQIGQKFEGSFTAVGGTAPYTWRFEGLSIVPSEVMDAPPPPTIINMDGSASSSSSFVPLTSGNDEPLNISGYFEPDLYCEKMDGTLVAANWDTICKNEHGDRSKRVYRTSIRVTVTDSSDRSVTEEYEFNFTLPSISNQKANEIFAIEANLSAHDCGGRWGCSTLIYLYGKDNIDILRMIGRGQPIDISSSGWGSTTQKRDFVFNSAIDPSTISLDTINKVYMTIDDGSFGDYGEMWLSSLIIYSSYYYMVLNLEDNQLGGEVGWDYDTSASRAISGVSWERY